MTLAKAEPKSQFIMRSNDFIDLLAQLTTQLSTQLSTQFTKQTLARGLGCAAELMNYFKHWNQWKRSHCKEAWFSQSLKKIEEDLRWIYSRHTIRDAIALLAELGFLSIDNDREPSSPNRYLVHCDRVEAALAKFRATVSAQSKKPKKAETPDTSPRFAGEPPQFAGEPHTKILSINPLIKSSLLERERKSNFVQEEEEIEDPWAVDEDEVEQEVSILGKDSPEILEKQEVFGEGHFSAPAEPKLTKMVETSTSPSPEPKCSEVVQAGFKPLPKLKSDRLSGFQSEEERDGFHEALVELGKAKGEVRSPAGWANNIIKDINAGGLCEYLNEYRRGEPVGMCEKQEWEVAPGQPYEGFVSYLKTRLKEAEMTSEQAIVATYRQLSNTNKAKSLWEAFKRRIVNLGEDREKQQQLGVQSAYLPPELMPERKVSLEQAAGALASLQSGCVQLQALEPATAEEKPAELEPAEEQPADPEPTLQELQEKSDSPLLASLARMRAREMGYRIEEDLILPAEGMPSVEYLAWLLADPLKAPRVQRLLDAHPDWGFFIEAGEIHDF